MASSTVGEQLKSARITRKSSIDEVLTALHIKPYFIEALEENRFSDIPSQAQVKGFIRLYAGWLNLPPQPLLDILDGKESESASNSSEFTTTSLPQEASIKEIRDSENITSSSENVSKEVFDDTNASYINKEEVISEEVTLEKVTSQLLFTQIGSHLVACREKLNISVEEIEKLTHIRAKYLTDMESGNFTEIPSLVQARGLLSGYSSFLNLDTDHLMSLFADALQLRRLELLPAQSAEESNKSAKKKKSVIVKPEKPGFKRFLTLDFLLGSMTIITVIVVAIIAAIQVTSNPSSNVSKPPPIAEVLRDNPAANMTTTSTPTFVATGVINPESIGMLPTSQPQNNFAPVDGTPTSPVPNLGNDSMQVYIVPNQRVFLQVITGKKTAFLGRTVPGNAYPFTSNERIEVISGNAAGIQIYYNQRDLGTLGLPGQTLRLIFSKDGVVTPTISANVAPTSTPRATLTLRPSATQAPPTVTPLIP
ncbi:MAG: helix-turn-helix domain-containing protein [Chloroflexi bacterium]|nr:helix-turn-helix domain-containing protein [Chloroflexota bacterium]